MPLLIFALLFFGILLLILARRSREQTGLPEGEVLYSDTWTRVERPLYSERLGLTGKPDYLVDERDSLSPVEVKGRPAPSRGPYDAHIFQLAAYCLLIVDEYRRRPARGFIKYRDRTYPVEFTPELERRTLALLEAMRADAEAEDVSRSHNSAAKCGRCGFREVCGSAMSTL